SRKPPTGTACRNGSSPPDERRIRAPLRCLSVGRGLTNRAMPDGTEPYARFSELIEPFNKKGVAITEATRFAQDLEWDSLTVLDFVANVEDEFDVIISMNMQAEIETVGQLVDALEKLKAARDCSLIQVRPTDRAARGPARNRGHRPLQPGHGEGRKPNRRHLQRQ